jgi:hypothetical protein
MSQKKVCGKQAVRKIIKIDCLWISGMRALANNITFKKTLIIIAIGTFITIHNKQHHHDNENQGKHITLDAITAHI